MSSMPASDSLIVDLESRQDEALRQLVELERRIEAVLRQALPASGPRPAQQQTGNNASLTAAQAPALRAA